MLYNLWLYLDLNSVHEPLIDSCGETADDFKS